MAARAAGKVSNSTTMAAHRGLPESGITLWRNESAIDPLDQSLGTRRRDTKRAWQGQGTLTGPTATPATGTGGKVATAAVYLAGDEATVGHGATRYS